MSTPLSPRLLEILQHSLGVDKYGQGNQHRNHFVTGQPGKDWDYCQELVSLGFMRDHGPQSIAGGNHCFNVTDEGKKAVAEQSPKPPKVPKKRRVYLKFLDVRDACPDLTFRDFLTHPAFKDTRKYA